MNAQALESAGRRVLALLPGRVGHFQHFGQVACTLERLDIATFDNRTGHATGKPLFAVFLEYAGDFLLGGSVDELGRADTAIRVHTHVQRAVIHKAEAALRVVKLWRRDTQIKQHAVDLASQTALGNFGSHFRKTALHNDKAAVFGRQRLPGGNRLWIFIEPEQTPLRAQLLEYQAAMSAATEGAIQIASIRAYGESLYGFVEQYGDVVEAAIYSHRIKSRSSSGIAPGC